jgi:hypothetical protein
VCDAGAPDELNVTHDRFWATIINMTELLSTVVLYQPVTLRHVVMDGLVPGALDR